MKQSRRKHTLDEGQRSHDEKDERSHAGPPSARLSRQTDHSTRGPEEEHDVEDYSPLGTPEIEFENVVDCQLDQCKQEHQTEPDEVDEASSPANRQSQYPLNSGSLFSANARVASLWSSESIEIVSTASEASSTRFTSSRRRLLQDSFVQRIALVGPFARR